MVCAPGVAVATFVTELQVSPAVQVSPFMQLVMFAGLQLVVVPRHTAALVQFAQSLAELQARVASLWHHRPTASKQFSW